MWSHRLLAGIPAVKARPPWPLAKVAVVAASLAATVFTLPVAHADDQTDEFLTATHAAFSDTPDDPAVVELGHTVCDAMDEGLTYNETGQLLQVFIPQVDPQDAGVFIMLAISSLCPAHVPDIPTAAPPPAPAPPPPSPVDADYLDELH